MKINDHIFITGATGLVGSYVARHLCDRGYRNITALKRETSKMDLLGGNEDKINWVDGDIRDMGFMEHVDNIDYIIHCAALVSFDPKDRDHMMDININGTANIVNFALDKNVNKLIYISSVAAIGKSTKSIHIDEKTEWEGTRINSDYSVSKHFAEREVWRGAAEGIDVFIVNPSIILGAAYWDDGSPALIKNVYKGLPFYPQGSSGFVDVRDVVSAVVIGLETGIVNERFLLNGFNMTYRELFTKIAEYTGAKPPAKPLPKWLGGFFWRLEKVKALITGIRPIVTKDTIAASQSDTIYDNSKSFDELGLSYRESTTTIEDICVSFLMSEDEGRIYGYF